MIFDIRYRLRFSTTNLVRTLCVFGLHALDLKASLSPFLYTCNSFLYLVMTCTNRSNNNVTDCFPPLTFRVNRNMASRFYMLGSAPLRLSPQSKGGDPFFRSAFGTATRTPFLCKHDIVFAYGQRTVRSGPRLHTTTMELKGVCATLCFQHPRRIKQSFM